jgi:hypothetical protein
MPWREQTVMSQRVTFCERAGRRGANVSALCREFEISPAEGGATNGCGGIDREGRPDCLIGRVVLAAVPGDRRRS